MNVINILFVPVSEISWLDKAKTEEHLAYFMTFSPMQAYGNKCSH